MSQSENNILDAFQRVIVDEEDVATLIEDLSNHVFGEPYDSTFAKLKKALTVECPECNGSCVTIEECEECKGEWEAEDSEDEECVYCDRGQTTEDCEICNATGTIYWNAE